MLVLSNRISFVLAATFACLAHGAEFPTALEGEVVSQKDGWRNTVAVRGLSFTEGRLAGRGDLSVKPRPMRTSTVCESTPQSTERTVWPPMAASIQWWWYSPRQQAPGVTQSP